MSGKGNGYDNAMVETVFKPLKSDLIWHVIFKTRAEAEFAIEHFLTLIVARSHPDCRAACRLASRLSRHEAAATGGTPPCGTTRHIEDVWRQSLSGH